MSRFRRLRRRTLPMKQAAALARGFLVSPMTAVGQSYWSLTYGDHASFDKRADHPAERYPSRAGLGPWHRIHESIGFGDCRPRLSC
jgi:hypothetical protein